MFDTRMKIDDVTARYQSAVAAIENAMALVENKLAKPRFNRPRGDSPEYLEMRRDLPYCIHETSNPGTWILVNRNYKPLGSNIKTGGERVDYDQVKNMHVQLSPDIVSKMSSTLGQGYIFNDGGYPWASRKLAEDYLNRLRWLHSLL